MGTSYEQYLNIVQDIQKLHPEWRPGQTYFNVLNEFRPDLSERVRGTLIDPFHSDSIIPEFLEQVQKDWNS